MDIASYFRFRAAAQPSHTALIYEGQTITYHQLDEQSDRIASALTGYLPSHSPIGVAMHRTPRWLAVMLGIWKAGGIYVPLDLDNPPQRLQTIIDDCAIPLVIRDSDTPLSFPVPSYDANSLLNAATRPLYRQPDENSPAYIIYTSGTTGVPKGVAIRHRQAVVMSRLGKDKFFHIRCGTRMSQLAGLGYSASLVETMTCLLNGGCMVMALEEERHNPQKLFTLLQREQVESAFIPPVLLGQMPRGELPCLKTLVVAGESVTQDTKDYWMKGRCMINAYGFTENTVLVMSSIYTSNTEVNDIGTPLPGVRAYVLNDALVPVASGVEGELCISGRQLADGYWRHPELSKEKFIPNPFATAKEKAKGHALLYRSGDRVVCRPDGHYMYLGRIDNQIKIRGARVETGEIEQCLNSYPGIRASAVLQKELKGRKELVAYLQTDSNINIPHIIAFVQERLPGYMCPFKYVSLRKFPLTPSQKTDRRRLPEPDWSLTDADTDRPATSTEQVIAQLWQDILKVNRIGRSDGFIASGGDSISIMLMTDKLEEIFGITVDPSVVYQRKELSALAEYVDCKLSEKTESRDATRREPYNPPAPLRNLLVDCLSSETRNTAYKLAVLIPWEDDLDVPILQKAWNRIIQEQDAMRLFFDRGNDGKYHIHTALFHETAIPVKAVLEDNFREEALQLYLRPLVPTSPPLHHECLYRLSNGTYILVLVLHHLITDGWSIRLLVHTLKTYYAQRDTRPGQAYSYREYARWYAHHLERSDTSKADFWRSYLNGCPELRLTGRTFTNGSSRQQGYALSLPMSRQSVNALHDFCRAQSVTPFVVCLCVYQILLTKYAGQDDFAVGAAFTDRRTADFRRLLGYATTLLPVRTLSGKTTFAGMVRQISHDIMLLSSNSLPLDMIGDSVAPDRKGYVRQLVRFTFGLEEMPTSLDIPDEWTTASPFDLSLSIYRSGSRYSYHYQYAARCFDTAFLTAFSKSFDVALLHLTTHPQKDIATCPLLTENKIADLCNAFHISKSAVPRPDVVESFERMARAFPDHDASVWDGRHISYSQLQEMSWRVTAAIAHRLTLTHGLCPPVPIGIRLCDKKHLLAGILGILKSGNSYVPLDAGLPRERLHFILKDAGIRLLLCDAPIADEGCDLLTMEEALAYNTHEAVTVDIHPTTTAYIIYTSGTTGQPKGTPVSHGSLALFAESQSHIFRLQSDSRVLQYASMGFDASVLEIFPALLSGATLIIPTEEERKDTGRLLLLLQREDVSCALIPPALLALLPYRSLPHLTTLAVGGESTPEDVMRQWAKGRRLINEYGPTENTVVTTCMEFSEGCSPDNIGKPLPGVACYVVDKDLHLMPDGIAGELCIGGLQLTGGYLHQDVLNKEKFVCNPFVLPEDKACGVNTQLYRSGDKVVRTADGSLLYMGRMDSQVKIRGFRIELDDIARCLEKHPSVLQALAVLRQSANGHPYIAAYLTARKGQQIRLEELRLYLRSLLPTYMIPSAWSVIDHFPMTPNGKIDASILPKATPVSTGSYQPPVGREETILTVIAARLLEREQVGVTTDLFDIGLTSLQAIELIADAREQGILISTTDLYKKRCIRDILAECKGDHFYCHGEEGTTDKPVMILIAYPSFTPHFDAFIKLFGEEYDFFVFESFLETADNGLCCHADNLVEYYYKTIMRELPGKKVSVVTGYCLGGEIAMLLAEKLRTGGMSAIKALVIDSFLVRDKQLSLAIRHAACLTKRHDCIISDLIRSLPRPKFNGEIAVCLTLRPYHFKTDQGEIRELSRIQQKNREVWKKACPHALFCEVDADHDHVFEEKYMKILHEVIKKQWSDEPGKMNQKL